MESLVVKGKGMELIESKQKEIDQTEYWDLEVLDIQINFFGDEVSIFVYNDADTSWKISFLSCYKVEYETDATWRTIKHVRDMKKPQLGYYGQNILLSKNIDFKDFFDVTIDLTILTATIICRDVKVEKISNDLLNIFAEDK